MSDGLIVAKGSKVATDTVPSMPISLIDLRNKLIHKGIIDQDYKFVSDYLFTSPSLAASVVMGRSANGRTEWKNINNVSIKELEENNF